MAITLNDMDVPNPLVPCAIRSATIRIKIISDSRSSGVLRTVDLKIVTDVSGQLVGAIFKIEAVHEECSLECLTLEDGTEWLFQDVGK